MQNNLIAYLSEFVTPQRLELFWNVLNKRTRYISVLLEDIYQPHNASAVLRSCECFGIQDVHILEQQNTYEINPDVVQGSAKWLDLKRYKQEPTSKILNQLKNKGYRIVATTPHKNDICLEEFDIHAGKFMLCFGTELNGLSEEAMQAADCFLKIPMVGFTESFNISVSAAIALHYLSQQLRGSNIAWQLTEDEKKELILQWLKKSIKRSDLLIEKFYTNETSMH